MKMQFVIPSLLLSLGLMAQSNDTTQLNAVTVTSSKIEVNSRESSKAVIVIDQEVIKRSVGKDLTQILTDEAGIIINGSMSNPGLNKTIYSQGAAGEFTLILIDGVPVNDPSLIGGNFDLRLIPVNQVESIEILTGSQSVLYGSDAIGGVINIITNKSVKDFNASVNLAYGNLNTLRTGIDIRQKVGANLEYFLNYQLYQTDGISEAAKPDSIQEEYKNDGLIQHSAQLKLAYTKGKWKVEPYLRMVDHQGDYDQMAWVDADNTFSSQMANYGLNVQFNEEDWKLRLLYSSTISNRNYNYIGWTGPTEDIFKGRADNIDLFTTERIGNKGRLLTGFFFQNMGIEDQSATVENPNYTIISPYATLYQPISNRFYFDLGFRFNIHSTYGTNFNYSFTPGWYFSDQGRLFASLSSGYKAPTLGQLYGQWGANPKLQPQESNNLEVGMEYDPFKQWHFDARFFNRTVNNLIIYGAMGYQNANVQEDQGFELRAIYTWSKYAKINVMYGFVDGTTRMDSSEDVSGLLRRPKHRLNIGISGNPSSRLSYVLQLNYNGDRTDQDFSTWPAQNIVLDSYLMLNAYVSYSIIEKHLDVFVDLKNIMNQSFMEINGFNGLPFTALIGVRANLK